MNRKSKLIRLVGTTLIAALLAGSVAMSLVQASSLPAGWLQAYLPALLAALACALIATSSLMAIVMLVTLIVLAGASVAMGLPAWQALQGLIRAIPAVGESGAQALAGMEGTLAAVIAVVFAAVSFALVHGRRRGETGLAVLLAACALIGANALSEKANLLLALPALAAGAAAYAQASEFQREGGFFRALIPAVLAVVLAFCLLPSGRVTWQPLENVASRVRHAFEDYFQFTQERVAFSINEAGYDHAGEVNGVITPMLGGPAQLDTEPVMRVETDSDLLLRGSIRRTYTGYSWTDDMEKARYLYYDFTRHSERDKAFDAARVDGIEADQAFGEANVSVEMLREGTSTLFVPNRLTDFSMALETAVYFNSIGEMFIARGVQPGDSYTAAAQPVADASALAAAVEEAALRTDKDYESIHAMYTQLPGSVEQGVYELVQSLTAGKLDPYAKVQAIQHCLQSEYTYTLDVGFPPSSRDFVSYFLLDSQEGYCSYFASAMTVMCRIAGIPARYVEGYYAVPDETGAAVLTGEDAHAWVEVYFNGLGWVEFDPTTAARENGNGDEQDTADEEQPGEDLLPDEPTPSPSPSPTPTINPENDDPFTDPTPTPTPETEPFAEPTPTPDIPDWENEPDEDPEKDYDWLKYLWLALILLLVLLIIVLIVRHRLRRTDPVRLASAEKDARRAALILYRSILTLLAQMGHVPLSGETPAVFAARIAGNGLDNEAFGRFARAVALMQYAGRAPEQEVLDDGLRAYAVFVKKLGRFERIRFAVRRVFSGLGDFEVIP